MSKDCVVWECESCKASPDVLYRVRVPNLKGTWITRYYCGDCASDDDKKNGLLQEGG